MAILNRPAVNKSVARAKTMQRSSEIYMDIGVSNHANCMVWAEIPAKCNIFSTSTSNLDAWPIYLSCNVELRADFLIIISWKLHEVRDVLARGQINRKCIIGPISPFWKESIKFQKAANKSVDKFVYHSYQVWNYSVRTNTKIVWLCDFLPLFTLLSIT